MGTEYGSHECGYGPSSKEYQNFRVLPYYWGGKQNTDATQRLYDALLSEGVEAGNVTSGFTRDGCTASVMYCHINYIEYIIITALKSTKCTIIALQGL